MRTTKGEAIYPEKKLRVRTQTNEQKLLARTKADLRALLQRSKENAGPDLRSSDIALAENYAFIIKALACGRNPNEYRRVSAVYRSLIRPNFGKFAGDILSTSFIHDSNGSIVKIRGIAILWRKKDSKYFLDQNRSDSRR